MDIFERASRAKLRFASVIGELTTEQLWDLPLSATSAKAVDLDKLARGVHSELKSIAEGSFVNLKPDPRGVELQLQLDILKHIIDSKITDMVAVMKRQENAERKRKLLEVLESKDTAALQSMSHEQIRAEIEKLGN